MRLFMLTLIPFFAEFKFRSFGCSLSGGFLIVSGRALMIISLVLPLLDSFCCGSLSLDESGMGMVGKVDSVFWLKPGSLFADCRGGVCKKTQGIFYKIIHKQCAKYFGCSQKLLPFLADWKLLA